MKKTNNYTLNRFYFEAKELIEKHNCLDPESKLRVQFEIKEDTERNGSPRLDCRICYESNHNFKFFSSRSTPEAALLEFEETILETKDEWPVPQTVSVELTEEPIQSKITK